MSKDTTRTHTQPPAPDPGPPPGRQSDEALLTIDQLRKDYVKDGRVIPVLKGVSRRLWQGEMVSLIGPSGVGKSTLLQVLGTLDLPTSGCVRYQDRDVFAMSHQALADFRNRSIGFVFQFHHLLPDFTARENVMLPALIAGMRPRDAEKRAKKILDDVGLSHRLTHRPGELSGGEQQRVAIARALVMDPMIVLADEPTGNLDEKTAQDIHQLLFSLNAEYNKTFLLVTHHQALAALLKRQWTMEDGIIVKDVRA